MKNLIKLIIILITTTVSAQGGYGPWGGVYAEPKTCESGWVPTSRSPEYIDAFYKKLNELNEYDLYAWLEFLEWDLRYQGVDMSSGDTPIQKTIVFRNLEGPVGIAEGMFDEKRVEIQIDPVYWGKLSKLEKLFLIYHEAGHDYWEIWHNEIHMLKPALSLIRNDISRNMFLDWRDEMFKYISDKNAKRNGACPVEEEDAPVEVEIASDDESEAPSDNDDPNPETANICHYGHKHTTTEEGETHDNERTETEKVQ